MGIRQDAHVICALDREEIDERKSLGELAAHPHRDHFVVLTDRGRDLLHSHRVDRDRESRQEFYARLVAHYAVRCLMWQAAQTQGLDPDRISFTGAIQVLGQGIIHSPLASQEQAHRLLKRMCADLTSKGALVAPRRLRFNCRVVKHICTRFRRKRPEHHNLTFKRTSFADILLI